MSEYKRLTKKFENGYVMVDCTNCPFCDKCDNITHYCQTTAKERLAELEDKIENGTLVEPPVIDMFEEIPFDKVDKTEFANTIAQETAEGIISDLKNYIAEYGHITKSMLDELAEKYILRYGVEVEDES